MDKRPKQIGIFVLCTLYLSVFVSPGFSAGKKLIVVTDTAQIYLEPDQKSRIIATLYKGDIVTLSSDRKFRRIFNYVYFTSQNTGCTKSGYVLESSVDKLFKVTKVITIQGESKKSTKVLRSDVYLDSADWGMSTIQLQNFKGKPAHQGESQGYEILGYQKRILDRDCLIGYYFAENKLKGAKFSFLDQHLNKNQNIADFKKIRDLLAQKYGRPIEDKLSWDDLTHKDDISEWGNAISQGHLRYKSRWLTSDTEVCLHLFGKEDEISLEITYKPIS